MRYTTVENLLANNGNIHSVTDTDTVETTLQVGKKKEGEKGRREARGKNGKKGKEEIAVHHRRGKGN